MSIKVTVKQDLYDLERKFSKPNVSRAKVAVANQVLMDSDQYIPAKRYNLRASGHSVNGSVIWTTVYARAQFYGTNGIVTFKKYTTSGTGSKWTEKASDKNMKNWEQVAVRSLIDGYAPGQ